MRKHCNLKKLLDLLCAYILYTLVSVYQHTFAASPVLGSKSKS